MDRSAPGRSCVAEQGGVAESEFSGARVEISGARLEFEESSYKDEKYTMCEIRSKYGAYMLLLRQ